jgi:phage terminase small subunit
VNKANEKKTAFNRLIIKHKLFVKNYIKHFSNGTRAYMDTYPDASYQTAKVNSSKLLSNFNIRQAIIDEYNQIYAKIQSKTEKAETYKLITAISESDISQIIDIKDGKVKIKDLSEISQGAIYSIQSISNNEIKLHSRLKALELRAKIQGLINIKGDSTRS